MLLNLLLFCCITTSLGLLRKPFSRSPITPANFAQNGTTYWFDVPLDHFAYNSDKFFKIRYIVNMDSFSAGGPIFFYAGNEGKIEDFMTATGIMWDLAAQFKAAVIFAEHRYYGQSSPFGTQNDFNNTQTMAYLTSEQALADYAELIYYLKTANHTDNSPSFDTATKIIMFGGSYGGMLAAWFRMKYPHLIVGAWASSAPLKYFNEGGVDWGAFDVITTRTFADSGANIDTVKNGWQAILRLSRTNPDYLNTLFKVDQKSLIKNETGGYLLYSYIREAFEYMAMADYPYQASFLEPSPGFPVKVAAKFLTGTNGTDEELAQMLNNASLIYYNYNNLSNYTACIDPAVCGDPGTANLGDDLGWPWQECTEIVIEMCARANSSFFLEECGTRPLDVLYNYCDATFTSKGWTKPMMRIDAVRNLYGLDISAYSNIILSQGYLDPWSAGGYKATDPGVDSSRGIYVVEIPGSAHHLDLRTPNTCDGAPMHSWRNQVVNILQCWLTAGCANPQLQPLPPLDDVSNITCQDIIHGYPWNSNSSLTTSTTISITETKACNEKLNYALFIFAFVFTVFKF